MSARLLPSICLIAGCGAAGGLQGGADGDVAKAAVEAAFTSANPPGRTGLELRGKSVWLETTAFDKGCLESKDLAFNDDPKGRPPNAGPRISPTYGAQRYLTATTEQGYCLLLGADPTLTIDDVSWGGDHYRVTAKVGMTTPTPWFECLTADQKERRIEVEIDEAGQATLRQPLDLGQGGCPHPLPAGEDRGPGTAAPKLTHTAPSKADVVALAGSIDKSLYDGDFLSVRDQTACYNLVDDKPFYGNCAVGDFISIGPSFQGEARAQDGTPWAEYTIKSLDDVGRIVADRADRGLFHVTMKHKRTGKDRSFSLKRGPDGWLMVGVISQKAEALTTVRFLNDLHRADQRDIFQRRLDGEEIDHLGEPLNPVEAEPAPQGGGGVVTF